MDFSSHQQATINFNWDKTEGNLTGCKITISTETKKICKKGNISYHASDIEFYGSKFQATDSFLNNN